MTALVLDASVASKLFLIEADSAKAWALVGADAIFAPAIMRVEVAAGITRQHRLGTFDEADARLKLEDMRAFVAAPAFSLIGDDILLPRAGEIAIGLRHPLQDCLYVACAEANGAELVTTDTALLKRAAGQFPFVRRL